VICLFSFNMFGDNSRTLHVLLALQLLSDISLEEACQVIRLTVADCVH
jgi:hypothetical protein